MLTAKKSAWFETVFRLYNRNLLRRRFSSLRVRNLQSLADNELPTIVYANHSSWWDGLVCYELFKRADSDMFVMMEQENLRRYPLFRKLGAFSVDRNNARSALASIEYAAKVAKQKPRRAILIFPQGKILHSRSRPFEFESGIVRLVERLVPCRVVPLALSYEFGREFKPEIFATVGEGLVAGPGEIPISLAGLATQLTNELDGIEMALNNDQFDNFTDLLR
ncbi:MAG: lysophospholipid acyltransferase family protein [Acidobacteria bacterium]|nr:lysophospholipid acyltransferase family protein [Acidobacteriota bacterium]